VGTVIYNHTVYPERYWGAFFMGDWSRGRIRVLFPKLSGATFEGKTQDFLVGEPLNVTDLDVGPDGLIYFTLGGRDTRGGMYRIRFGDKTAKLDAPATAEEVVAYPMPRSAWGRYALANAKKSMGKAWSRELTVIARDPRVDARQRIAAVEALQVHGPRPSLSLLKNLADDERAEVRAMAVYLLGTYPLKKSAKLLIDALDDRDAMVVRRACDALVRAGVDTEIKFRYREELAAVLLARLNDPDRFVRYAARTLIERLPREAWAEQVLSDDIAARPYGALEGLVALIHTQQGMQDQEALFERLEAYSNASMSEETLLGYLRTLQLAFIRCDAPGDRIAASVGPKLLAKFPSSSLEINRELQVVLAHMETPGTIDALLAYMTPDKTQEEQIHTAYCLRTITQGWDKARRTRMVDWFDRAREMTGGASFEGFITFIWDDTLKLLPEPEKEVAVARKEKAMAERAQKALALLEEVEGEQVSGASELAQMSFQEISEYLEYDPMSYPKNDRDWTAALERGERTFIKARCANCHVFGTKGKGGGPDLSTVASRFRRADILEAIMYPSKVVSDQYIGLEVELEDFSTVVGMVVSEDETTLTLIDVSGTRIDIPKSEIVSRKEAGTSTMPEGLLNTMSLSDLVALVNFLERGAEPTTSGAQMSAVAR
jgi:putative heme-binding domain-containing protein